MTEVELENICVQRGFQLVNDDSDDLTKQDYIEAAQRCLAIEQEMNELLAQYPELADELEEEIKRMEEENSEQQGFVEALESEISNIDSTDDNGKDSDVAFARSLKDGGMKNDDDIVEETESDKAVVFDEDAVHKEKNDAFSNDGKEVKGSNTIDEKAGMYSSDSTSEITQLDDGIETDMTETIGKEIETQGPSAEKQDLTLTHIAIESLRVLVKNAQDDVKRIINLAIPVLQPIFDVGDAAWRQMKAIFISARDAYFAYHATNTPSNEETDESESCDYSSYS
eukprot:CAMPEP_0197183294 /NCGR_PEP_ID=MMETSP1423-20130617/7738_1 /TAXON_ID=476441 /ORGANISM="Pseudo-nitzschia heimii, Strain UNC1101" /LENGTH=282 /DNA_ID=CAMNT_0042633859 /DNA_START=341 /DNA_END=1189 /DNA_ORIENTATION=-